MCSSDLPTATTSLPLLEPPPTRADPCPHGPHGPHGPQAPHGPHARQAFEASAWHTVAEDATFKKAAASLGLEPRELLALNTARLKGLTLSSLLLKGTLLQVTAPDPAQPHNPAQPPTPPNPQPRPQPQPQPRACARPRELSPEPTLQIAEPPKDLRPVPQQLVNRVVEIDGEDDYRYW